MKDNDRVRLHHMLDAARELALTKEIEIIGEAASRISPAYKMALPNVPWAMVVGIRNRLTHAYFDLELSVIWATLTVDLPELIRELEKVLPVAE